MPTPPKAPSPADRRSRQDRAQKAAMQELESVAARRREQSEKLRRLRMSNDCASAQQFCQWRARNAKEAG